MQQNCCWFTSVRSNLFCSLLVQCGYIFKAGDAKRAMTTVIEGCDVGTVHESGLQTTDPKGTSQRDVSFAIVTVHFTGAQGKDVSIGGRLDSCQLLH